MSRSIFKLSRIPTRYVSASSRRTGHCMVWLVILGIGVEIERDGEEGNGIL